MRDNFDRCLGAVLSHEGGWADHPSDPGGATMKGITIGTYRAWKGRRVTKSELRQISDADVAAIYRQNYWAKVRGDELPEGIDLVAFDPAVNSGVSRGSRWLQIGLGIPRPEQDGKVGPNTVGSAQMAPDGVRVIQRACAARMGFLRGLRTWGTFGKGWARRVASVEAEAVAMNTHSAMAVRQEGAKARKAATKETAGAAGAGGGGAGLGGIEGLPDIAAYGLIALAVIVAVILVSKSRVNKVRATAYAEKAKEMMP